MKRNIITNKTKGFTIVELLVVIVVIGILAAISIVSYTGVTKKANATAGKANAQSVVAAAEAYAADGEKSGFPVTIANLKNGSYAKLPEGINFVDAIDGDSTSKDIIYAVVKATESENTGACATYNNSGTKETIFAGTATTATCTVIITP